MSDRLTLRDLDGDEFEVGLVRAGTRAGLPSATFELDAATWDRIEAVGALHTDPERSGGRTRTFDAARPVVVEAVLDPLAAAETDDVEAALRGDEDGLLRSTESWWVLSATQEVPLPGDLAGSGRLQEGIAYAHPSWLRDVGTSSLGDAWERAFQLADRRELDPSEPLLGLVQAVFEDEEWYVERPDDEVTALHVPVEGERGGFDLWVRTDEAAQLVTVYAVLPHEVPATRVADVFDLAARLNQSCPVGSYEVDPDDGTLCFKTGVDVTGDRLSVALLRRMVQQALAGAEAAWSPLRAVVARV